MSNQTCTDAQLNDATNNERIHECSTVTSCYDFGAHAYSNDKCVDDESCGTWRKKGDILLQGCIKSQFCDKDAEYEGNPTKYNCPQGAKVVIKRPVSPKEPQEVPQNPGGDKKSDAAPAKVDRLGRKPLFNLMGYTDLDILDAVEGLMGGLMKKDVRNTYNTCYEGVPKIVMQVKDEVVSIDWKDLFNWSKDWKEIQDSWGFMQKIITEVPEELSSCSLVVTEVVQWVMGLINTLNFVLLWTNLSTKIMGLMIPIMAKGSDVGMAFSNHDFYKIGQDVGGIIQLIIDLGVDPKKA